MSQQISRNVRYLLWRKKVPRDQWAAWIARRTSLSETIENLVSGRLDDAQITSAQLGELGRALEVEDDGENLRFVDLASEGSDVLLENLRYLFESLGHGGKKTAAEDLSIDPTTVSRWLSGAYKPQRPLLRRLAVYFGLPPDTDLRETPIFLSSEPISLMERRQWLQARIERLSAEELRELYPALRRLLVD